MDVDSHLSYLREEQKKKYALESKVKALEKQNADLQEQLRELHLKEKQISTSIIRAEGLSEQIIDEAKIKAQKLIQEAHHTIREVYQNFESKRVELETQHYELLSKVNRLKGNLNSMNASHTNDFSQSYNQNNQSTYPLSNIKVNQGSVDNSTDEISTKRGVPQKDHTKTMITVPRRPVTKDDNVHNENKKLKDSDIRIVNF